MEKAVTHPRRRSAVRSPKVVQRRSRIYEELLAVGAERFANKGVGEVSVGELLEAVGISRRTFYGFFENKYQIVAALLNPVFDAGTMQLEALARGPARAVLRGVVDMYLVLWREHRSALQIIATVTPEAFPYIEDGHRHFGRALRMALAKCESADLLLNGSADESFRVISRTAVPLLKIYCDRPDLPEIYTRSMLGLLAKHHE